MPRGWPENPPLGVWGSVQRRTQKAGKLSSDRVARLEALGFEWELLANDWEANFVALAAYKAKHGDCRVPQNWPQNPALYSWVNNHRTAQKGGKLPSEKVARLEALGFEWDPYTSAWEACFAELAAYKAKHGDCRVPRGWPENPSLASWVSNQRTARRTDKLSAERVARLEALGFKWSLSRD